MQWSSQPTPYAGAFMAPPAWPMYMPSYMPRPLTQPPLMTPTRTIRVRFLSDWLLHHGDNRGRHSANHNLLPDMHLRVPVLRVKTCRDSRLI